MTYLTSDCPKRKLLLVKNLGVKSYPYLAKNTRKKEKKDAKISTQKYLGDFFYKKNKAVGLHEKKKEKKKERKRERKKEERRKERE